MILKRELPTKPGWYWFKLDVIGGSKSLIDPGEPRVVYVAEFEGHLLFGDGRVPNRLSAWPGQWAGPLRKPKLEDKP